MIFDCTKTSERGVFYDDGTGRRVPFVRWANIDTGEYVALEEGPDGPTDKQYRGRAVGRLRFVPLAGSQVLTRKPVDLEAGLEKYRRLFFDVWKFREMANKHITERWCDRVRRLRSTG